jgi:hypothetical protein
LWLADSTGLAATQLFLPHHLLLNLVRQSIPALVTGRGIPFVQIDPAILEQDS